MAEVLRDLDTIEGRHAALLGSVILSRTWYNHTRNEEGASFGDRMRDLRRLNEAEERLVAFRAIYSVPLPEVDHAA